MSNTYTPAIQLAKPATGDRSWDVAMNGNSTLLDALTPVGGLSVSTAETPSASLNVRVAGGQFVDQSGTVQTYAGTASQAVAATSTKVLYLDGTASWALTVAASYPATPHVRLGTVVTGSATITSIADNRQAFTVCGSVADGVNITLGTVTGTQIGTAVGQKLAFFGKTPVVQPTMCAATASGSYTSVEQGMLQAVYNAVRALGLGS
jgi:hypothetical protein